MCIFNNNNNNNKPANSECINGGNSRQFDIANKAKGKLSNRLSAYFQQMNQLSTFTTVHI